MRPDKVTFAAMAAATTLGTLVGFAPLAALAGVAAILVLFMATKPMGRLAIFVLGGLFAMGGDSGLGALKLVYAGLVALCFVISAIRISQIRDMAWRAAFKRVLPVTYAIAAVAVIATSVGLLKGYELALVAQDAFTYILIAVAPVVGADASYGSQFKRLRLLVVTAGIVAASSWAIWWLARRGSAIGGLERLTMVTSFLGFAVFAIALVFAFNARKRIHRLGWVVLAIAVPVTYIASGSRSMIVFALGLLGVLGAQRFGRVPVTRWLIASVALGAVAIWSLPSIIRSLPDGDNIMKRFTRTFNQLDSSGTGIEADGSFIERSRAYAFTLDAFAQAPLFGQGFGHIYPSVSGDTTGDLKVDSPLLILSKFGLIGTLAFVFMAFALWKIVRMTTGPGQLRLSETVLKVFAFITLGRMFFVAPTEDKGFAYAIAIMVCFALMAYRAEPSEFKQVFIREPIARTTCRQTSPSLTRKSLAVNQRRSAADVGV